MKSIRTRIITVLFTAVIATAGMLLAISILAMNTLNTNDSDLLLEHIGREHALEINRSLDSLEQAVNSIYYYAYDQAAGSLKKNLLKKDISWRQEYLAAVEAMALSEAGNTDNVEVVYYRLATELGDPGGFLYQYYEGTGRLQRRMMTNITRYAEDDMEHVGWYYIPKNAKEAVWLGPYDNYNLKMRMISYEVPIYLNDEFIGVVGMDIDISALNRELSGIRVYQSGSAILFDQEDNIIYQKSHTRGLAREKFSEEEEEILAAAHQSALTEEPETYGGNNEKLFATRLSNGMILCITAPIEEINAMQRTVLMYSVAGSILILAVVTFVTFLLINNFLRPLKELTKAAKQLSDGNMDITLHYKGADEIGTLSQTFEMMSDSLKSYFEHFHGLAYTDNLTGLNNKAAFQLMRDVIESEIRMGRAHFMIIVMDVNNLKTINDTIGHEMGDELLKHVTVCMRKAFVGYPLYRIGGDEFCSIINKAADEKELIRNLQTITAEMSKQDYDSFKVHYQIAAGAAIYEKEIQDSFQSVFNRADQAMYENKRLLKGEG